MDIHAIKDRISNRIQNARHTTSACSTSTTPPPSTTRCVSKPLTTVRNDRARAPPKLMQTKFVIEGLPCDTLQIVINHTLKYVPFSWHSLRRVSKSMRAMVLRNQETHSHTRKYVNKLLVYGLTRSNVWKYPCLSRDLVSYWLQIAEPKSSSELYNMKLIFSSKHFMSLSARSDSYTHQIHFLAAALVCSKSCFDKTKLDEMLNFIVLSSNGYVKLLYFSFMYCEVLIKAKFTNERAQAAIGLVNSFIEGMTIPAKKKVELIDGVSSNARINGIFSFE